MVCVQRTYVQAFFDLASGISCLLIYGLGFVSGVVVLSLYIQ